MNPVLTELERAAMATMTWAETADEIARSTQSAAVRVQARKLLGEIAILLELEKE